MVSMLTFAAIFFIISDIIIILISISLSSHNYFALSRSILSTFPCLTSYKIPINFPATYRFYFNSQSYNMYFLIISSKFSISIYCTITLKISAHADATEKFHTFNIFNVKFNNYWTYPLLNYLSKRPFIKLFAASIYKDSS